MNEEMKRLFGRFLFVTVIIVCLSAFLCGSTTVRERGEYNMYLTEYAVMSFSAASEKLEASIGNEGFSLEIPLEKVRSRFRKFICLTPLSPFYYIRESIGSLLR